MKCFFFAIVFIAAFYSVSAQTPAYTLKSSDGEFSMELLRSDYTVTITMLFTHATQLQYVLIERGTSENSNFIQCKYIGLGQAKSDSIIVKERDNYPLTSTQNVFYRLKTISKEGIIRTYPPVRLPAVSKRSPNHKH